MKNYDDIINGFDSIPELPVSEEMLGAYLEGELVGSELRNVQNYINANDYLDSFVDDLHETSPFDLDTCDFDAENKLFDVNQSSSFMVNDYFDVQAIDSMDIENIDLPHIPDDDSIENINDSLNSNLNLSEVESDSNLDDGCINNIDDACDIL